MGCVRAARTDIFVSEIYLVRFKYPVSFEPRPPERRWRHNFSGDSPERLSLISEEGKSPTANVADGKSEEPSRDRR